MTSRLSALLALLVLAVSATSGEAAGRFACLGIGGGGQMYGVGISPHDPKLMHVSCDMGTFYLSEDGGGTWEMVDGLGMVGITSCRPAYHPREPGTLLMPYYRNQQELRISRDRGRTWKTMCAALPWGNPKGRDKYEVGVIALNYDRLVPDVVYACTAAGLWRSADGGRTFQVCPGIADEALWVHAGVGRTIAASASGVHISQDGGLTWAKRGTGLPAAGMMAFSAASDAAGRTGCCAVYKGSAWWSADGGESFTACDLPKTDYRFVSMPETDPACAWITNFGGDFGAWRTTNGGKSWERVYSPKHEGIAWGWLAQSCGKGFGGRANCITVAPGDRDLAVYVNTAEMFITRDGGKSWTEACSRPVTDPASPKGQPTWRGTGLEVALPTDLVWDPHRKNRAYLIYGDIGFLISTDRGSSWRRSVAGIPGKWVNRMWQLVADPDLDGVLYAACNGQHGTEHDLANLRYEGGVVSSRDGGESWKAISEGLPTKGTVCTSVALDPRSPKEARVLYCVMQNNGVWKSIDGGSSWVRKSEGLGRSDNRNVEQIRMMPDGTLYALVIGRSEKWKFRFGAGGLWRSDDGAETWREVTAGIDLAYPKMFAVNPRDPRHIFIATTQAPSREAAGLWETHDGGVSWKQRLTAKDLGKDLFAYIHSGEVVFHPTNPSLVYYSTKTHGIWISRDAGVTWARLLGVPRLSTGNIAFDPMDPASIYICSVGLWKGPATGY